MSSRTIHTCDKCKKDTEKFSRIAVDYIYSIMSGETYDLCPTCLEELRLWLGVPNANP